MVRSREVTYDWAMTSGNGYQRGLTETGDGVWAWLQPDGGWGWSNAGLIVDGDQSLLVDTLFDSVLTADMLAAMAKATGIGPDDIAMLVNTHANGDHCHGNGLVPNAEIIASAATTAEMEATDPAFLAEIMKAAPTMGDLGDYLLDIFGPFDFAQIDIRNPTRTFDRRLDVTVGDKVVELINVGPAHTEGDVLVHLPDDSTVFTGDILFIDGTPLIWAGPVANWLNACDIIIEMGAETIVPGHGPLTDAAGVQRVKDYLSYIDGEARQRFADSMAWQDAARDIDLGPYADWLDSERIAINVNTLYREYGSAEAEQAGIIDTFGAMAAERKRRAQT